MAVIPAGFSCPKFAPPPAGGANLPKAVGDAPPWDVQGGGETPGGAVPPLKCPGGAAPPSPSPVHATGRVAPSHLNSPRGGGTVGPYASVKDFEIRPLKAS